MDESRRDQLRDLQDRWLALPVVRRQCANYGDDQEIAGPGSPSFAQVQHLLLPSWESFFQEFFDNE